MTDDSPASPPSAVTSVHASIKPAPLSVAMLVDHDNGLQSMPDLSSRPFSPDPLADMERLSEEITSEDAALFEDSISVRFEQIEKITLGEKER